MNDVLVYSKNIKNIANEILNKTSLINILSEFGEVFIVGSYKYDLMWGPDIDIVVKCEDPRKASKEALQRLIELRLFQKYEYGDFEKFKMENRPESYIMNLKLPYANQKWEIETWFFKEVPQSQLESDELIRTKLNEENKKTILEMKKKINEGGIDKHQISSYSVYKKVLVDGVKKITSF